MSFNNHLKKKIKIMTNVELIKELLATVENRGVLPVYIDAAILRDYEESKDSVEDVVCNDKYVTLYNY